MPDETFLSRPPQDKDEQIFIYPENFPYRELDKKLQDELHSASELDPVLHAWCIEDSDESSVEMDASLSSEEEDCGCRGLLEDTTHHSVTDALKHVAVAYQFHFENELREAKLDIYGRVACVNLLRTLVFAERLSAEDTLKRWRDYVQKLGKGEIQLDTHLLQSYFPDDPLLHFAANFVVQDEWDD